MAYEPTNWKSGDVVTSAKLNKLEQGVAGAGGILVVHATKEGDISTLDKTWQEIHDAFFDEGRIVALVEERLPNFWNMLYVNFISVPQLETYAVGFDKTIWSTNSPSGYPAYTEDDEPSA